MVDGTVTEYFASALTSADVEKFGHPIGCADGQQVWEALAILVAVDLWTKHWQQKRIILKIKGDNVAALYMVIKMRPALGSGMAIVARELALRLVDLSFPPDAEHVPGIAHILADKLSRVYSPTGTGVLTDDLHPALPQAMVATAPPRVASYYRL